MNHSAKGRTARRAKRPYYDNGDFTWQDVTEFVKGKMGAIRMVYLCQYLGGESVIKCGKCDNDIGIKNYCQTLLLLKQKK